MHMGHVLVVDLSCRSALFRSRRTKIRQSLVVLCNGSMGSFLRLGFGPGCRRTLRASASTSALPYSFQCRFGTALYNDTTGSGQDLDLATESLPR